MWKGTVATLNPKPAMRNTIATTRGGATAAQCSRGWGGGRRSGRSLGPADPGDEGDPEEDDCRADGPDDEELDRGRRRLGVLLPERDESEGAQARRLEGEEEDEQVRRRGRAHHPA